MFTLELLYLHIGYRKHGCHTREVLDYRKHGCHTRDVLDYRKHGCHTRDVIRTEATGNMDFTLEISHPHRLQETRMSH